LCSSEAAHIQAAIPLFAKELLSENRSYRKRMVQKSFTMWPRMKSSMANTVSFLTAVDNRFIFLLGFAYGPSSINAHTLALGFGTSSPHGAARA
jgi:hypothetical protein